MQSAFKVADNPGARNNRPYLVRRMFWLRKLFVSNKKDAGRLTSKRICRGASPYPGDHEAKP
jgi:hypothetical protein